MSQTIQVILAEDHELTRQGLAYGLEKFPGIRIIGEAENGQDVLALVAKNQPDIVIMDVVMPVLNGIAATRQLKAAFPNIRVLMLTSHNEEEKVFEAFAAGADGYCMKDVRTERLAQVIEMVLEGVLWIDPKIAGLILKVMPMLSEKMAQENKKSQSVALVDLTVREKEILRLIAQGLNNKDIAETLSISLFTVKNHVSSIIQKLAVEDRTQAAILALKHDIL